MNSAALVLSELLACCKLSRPRTLSAPNLLRETEAMCLENYRNTFGSLVSYDMLETSKADFTQPHILVSVFP